MVTVVYYSGIVVMVKSELVLVIKLPQFVSVIVCSRFYLYVSIDCDLW